MNILTKPPACLLPLVFCGALAAQLPPGISFPDSVKELPLPAGTGDITRVGVLKWGATEHLQDAVVLRGGSLSIMYGVGAYNFVVAQSFPLPVRDFVRIPKGNPADARLDAILATDATSGVVTLLSRNPTTELTEMQGFTAPAWQDARMLTSEVDATGVEVGGVALDGSTFLRGRVQNGAWMTVSAATIGRTVLGLALGDDNGDGVLETFFLSIYGLHVFTRDGTFVRTVLGHHPGGAITRLGDRIAWLRRNQNNTGHELFLATGAPGITNWPAITLNGQDFLVSGLFPCNVDKQDQGDVFISEKSTQQALSVRLSATPGTLIADTTVVDLTATPGASGANFCAGVAADFDGDGYDGLFTAWHSGAQANAVLAEGFAVRNGTANVMAEILDTTMFDFGTTNNGVVDGLYLRLNHTDEFFSGAFSHVRVQMYWQPSGTEDVGAQAVLGFRYSITQPSWTPTCHSLFLQLQPEWGSLYDPAGFFHLEVVFETQGSGGTFTSGPFFTIAGFAAATSDPEYFDETYLGDGDERLNHLIEESASIVEVRLEDQDNPLHDPPLPGRVRIGGACRTDHISPFNGVPKPKMPLTLRPTTPSDT